MRKLTKNQKSVAEKVELGKAYTLDEASKLVKEITTTKFDAAIDIDVRLGVDPRKANQMVRGVVTLPNGTGKVTLKSQQYYILSDDHSVSRDSRTLGAVSKNEIRGLVITVIRRRNI